ncbi:hypothetical protein DPEC_G00258920 [Dallia pectoralis]|uniref:Uncharacterized protein n=1 Tax=Dallia pectoralis TaxID=75939 RepID=A0ACC2FR40_DALPE|nr:hypothetical protein DPEC_G00258920 [Dallia pectoralis]
MLLFTSTMENVKPRIPHQGKRKRTSGHRLSEQARCVGPATKRKCSEKTDAVLPIRSMDYRTTRKYVKNMTRHVENRCTVVPGLDTWGQSAVFHRSPGAEVKVAVVKKTSLKNNTDTETAPRKRRKIHSSGFRGKGQLSVSITPQNGCLDIKIIEARGLSGKEHRTCDSYVKLAIIPDIDHSTRRKTHTVLDCKSPVYNESFLLVVCSEDHQKRLLVTVWSRNPSSRRSEFLGCMSFGIRSLITSSKVIHGWYYLLDEELGRSKHLKVASRYLANSQESADAALSKNGPPVSETALPTSPENMQCRTVTIIRGKDGFGFTIFSDSPVRIQAVDPDPYLGLYLGPYMSLYLSLYLGLYLSLYSGLYSGLYLSPYLGPYLDPYLGLCLGLYQDPYLGLYLGPYLSLYLSLYLGLYLSLYMSPSLSLYLSLYLGLYLSLYFGLYLGLPCRSWPML